MDLQTIQKEHSIANWEKFPSGGSFLFKNRETGSSFMGTIAALNEYCAVVPDVSASELTAVFDPSTAKVIGYNLGNKRLITISSEEADDDDGAPDGAIHLQITA